MSELCNICTCLPVKSRIFHKAHSEIAKVSMHIDIEEEKETHHPKPVWPCTELPVAPHRRH